MADPPVRRCSVPTRSGEPCKTILREGQEQCWQHRGAQCAVCLATMGGRTASRILGCGHEFHERCLNRWKLTCQETPTCPMCREPFDVPTYKCRLIIERSADSFRHINDFETSNIAGILDGSGLQIRELVPSQGRFLSDIRFDIDPEETLQEILRELGLPVPPPPFLDDQQADAP